MFENGAVEEAEGRSRKAGSFLGRLTGRAESCHFELEDECEGIQMAPKKHVSFLSNKGLSSSLQVGEKKIHSDSHASSSSLSGAESFASTPSSTSSKSLRRSLSGRFRRFSLRVKRPTSLSLASFVPEAKITRRNILFMICFMVVYSLLAVGISYDFSAHFFEKFHLGKHYLYGHFDFWWFTTGLIFSFFFLMLHMFKVGVEFPSRMKRVALTMPYMLLFAGLATSLNYIDRAHYSRQLRLSKETAVKGDTSKTNIFNERKGKCIPSAVVSSICPHLAQPKSQPYVFDMLTLHNSSMYAEGVFESLPLLFEGLPLAIGFFAHGKKHDGYPDYPIENCTKKVMQLLCSVVFFRPCDDSCHPKYFCGEDICSEVSEACPDMIEDVLGHTRDSFKWV